MFYTIDITTNNNNVPVEHTLGFYQNKGNAKEALMDWARGVLSLSPDRKYREEPVDKRTTEKIVLCVTITDGNNKPFIRGRIVEKEFNDQQDKPLSIRWRRLIDECVDKTRQAVAATDKKELEIAYEPEDENDDNVQVIVYGNHGRFDMYVTKLFLDEGGNIRISGIDTEEEEYEGLRSYDIADESWPFLTDTVIDIIKQEPDENPEEKASMSDKAIIEKLEKNYLAAIDELRPKILSSIKEAIERFCPETHKLILTDYNKGNGYVTVYINVETDRKTGDWGFQAVESIESTENGTIEVTTRDNYATSEILPLGEILDIWHLLDAITEDLNSEQPEFKIKDSYLEFVNEI